MRAAAGPMARRRALLLALIAAASAAVVSQPLPCVAGNLACANGGACMFDRGVGTYCACAPGFAGALCGQLVAAGMGCTRNGSLVAYCMNGGLCPSANVSTSYCDCTTIATDAAGNTFRGAHCEFPAVQCPSSPSACLNGGSCTRTAGGTYICTCAPGWAGGQCEKYSPSTLPSPPPARTPGTVEVKGWVAGPVIGCVAAVLLCGCVFNTYLVRRERAGRPVFAAKNGAVQFNDDVSPTRGAQLARYSRSEQPDYASA